MMAGFGATRAIRDSRPRSPVPGSQTNLVSSVRPACFGSAAIWSEMQCSGRLAKRQKAGRSHGYVGVLGDMRSIAPIVLLSWPDEVSRPVRDAPAFYLGATELFLIVSAVCS